MRTLHVPALALVVASAAALAAQQQPPATFRSDVTVVPIDVRVVDRSGRPITNLTASDFTIVEDGVEQEIVHFAVQTLRAAAEPKSAPQLELRKPLGETVTTQDRRVFLIVLGRGRQVGPVKGVEGARRFISDRLLPQDQVAVLGFNRSTSFTTDHRKVIETLDRYWRAHEGIESRLRHHFSGLAAVYGSREIPKPIQADIDAIFRAPGAVPSRAVDAIAIPDGARLAEDVRRNRDLIQRAEMASQRREAGSGTLDIEGLAAADLMDEGFDAYVEKSFDTETDLGNLYAGIRYLRWLDGEKHLVFISPSGLFLPRLESAHSLAALASDARVTISVIHTYGTSPFGGLGQIFQRSNSQQIAALTGGRMTSTMRGDAFFRALDETTRVQYLLGYTPANSSWDGRFRRIQVRVNRKDARVMHRNGYAGRREVAEFDRQQYRVYSRIASAANVPRNIDDLPLALDDVSLAKVAGGQVVTAPLRILPGAVEFPLQDGFYVGKMELVAVCADARQQMVGELWQTLDFKLTPENYERFRQTGVTLTMSIGVGREPQYVKAIVYDYGSDQIGTVMLDLKKK
jgi:VWFA-related protein